MKRQRIPLPRCAPWEAPGFKFSLENFPPMFQARPDTEADINSRRGRKSSLIMSQLREERRAAGDNSMNGTIAGMSRAADEQRKARK